MKKINVLLITGVVTSEHDYRETNRNLVSLLESTMCRRRLSENCFSSDARPNLRHILSE